jgi:hypothetical protein
VPEVRGDADLPVLRTKERALRVSEAFPRRPSPHHHRPTPDEIRQAREDFVLHIPSLFHRRCLAAECGEEWPCPPWRHAAIVLERAGLIDVNGELRGP